jgi:hypothetical protein
MWAYLGELDPANFSAPGANDAVFLYDTQSLPIASQGTFNGVFGADVYGQVTVRGGAHLFIDDIVTNDCDFLTPGVLNPSYVSVDRGNIDTPERCWDAITRSTAPGDTNGNPWRAWVGTGRHMNYAAIGTEPMAYVQDGKWRSDPGGSPLNPWQLKPGIGKILNYRWAPKRDGYWLTDPATFLMEEVSVDAAGNISPSMAEISRTENLLGYMAALSQFSAAKANKPWTPPPNWNVEANEMNPAGPEGDLHGYWIPDPSSETGFTWVHDPSIDLTPYY